jgi:hypothetical protein
MNNWRMARRALFIRHFFMTCMHNCRMTMAAGTIRQLFMRPAEASRSLIP